MSGNPDISNASTLISAFSGLLGALIGALSTGIGQKLSDDRKVENERIRETETELKKSNIIRALIRSELCSIRDTFEGEILFIQDKNNTFTWVPTIGFLQTINKDITVLGQLTPSETGAVMGAFYVYQENTWYIKKNSGNKKSSPTIGASEPIGYKLEQEGDTQEERDSPRTNLKNDLEGIIAAVRLAIQEIDNVNKRRADKPEDRLWMRDVQPFFPRVASFGLRSSPQPDTAVVGHNQSTSLGNPDEAV